MKYFWIATVFFLTCGSQIKSQPDTGQDIPTQEDRLQDTGDVQVKDLVNDIDVVEITEVQNDEVQRDTRPSDTLVRTHNWVQKGNGVIPEAFDFRGITGGPAGMYLVGAGPSAYLYANDSFFDLTSLDTHLPPALYAVATDGDGGAFAAGMHGFLSHVNAKGWDMSVPCKNDLDCDIGDPCSSGKCTDNVCVFEHGTGKNCCGNTHFSCDFDTDMCKIQVQDLYLSPEGGLIWNRVCDLNVQDEKPRSTSGKCAMYFGDPTHTCPTDPSKICPTFDNGNTVGAIATIPWIDLPASAGKISLTFEVFIDVEDAEPYDDLSVRIITHTASEKKLWDRGSLGIHTNGFIKVAIPLDDYAGKSVQLVFRFDSKYDWSNYGEGAYVDDIRVASTCSGQQNGMKLPDQPIFALCSGPQNTVFLGGMNGYAGKVKHNSVTRLGSGKPDDFIGVLPGDTGLKVLSSQGDILKLDDNGATFTGTGFKGLFDVSENQVAVGKGGMILRINDQGAKSINSPVSVDLFGVFSCDKDTDIAVGTGGRILKITATGAVLESTDLTDDLTAVWCKGYNDIWVAGKLGRGAHYDGTGWTAFQTDIQGTILAITGDGQGHIIAVGDKGQSAYFNGQKWLEQDSPVLKNLWSVVFLDRYNAIAVGEGGTITRWKSGTWYPSPPLYNRNFRSINCKDGKCTVLGQGIILSQDKDTWQSIYADAIGNIRDCSVFTPDNALFVTTKAEVLRYNGRVLTLEPVVALPQKDGSWAFDDSALYGVAIDKTHQVAVGEGGIELSPDKEGNWARTGLGQDRTLRDICITDAGDIFEVGAAGRVVHYYPKGDVHIEDVPGTGNLTGAWCGTGGVAVVGEAGQFYLY